MTPSPGSRGALRAKSLASVGDLLGAAREAFGSDGYEATTLDAVAARAGRTKGTIYHHFPTKLALFEQVFVDEQRRLVHACATAGARQRNPVAALEAGVGAYLEEIGDPAVARITLIDGPAVLGWKRWRSCDDSSFRRLLTAGLEAIDSAGRLPGYDVEILADLLLGAITEIALTISHEEPEAQRIPERTEQTATLIRHLID